MEEKTPPSVLPDISLSRGEIGWSASIPFQYRLVPRSQVADWERSIDGEAISPLEGEMSSRTEGGSLTQRRLRGHLHAH